MQAATTYQTTPTNILDVLGGNQSIKGEVLVSQKTIATLAIAVVAVAVIIVVFVKNYKA